jgi:hypothetical protein
VEQLPKIVGQRLQAVSRTETHPDANLLTAFVEKSLLPREHTQILEHLAGCVPCREVVAHAQPEEVLQRVAVAAAAVPVSVRQRSWFQGAAVRWVALAACVVVVGAVVISRTQFERTPVQKVTVQAEPAVVAKTETQPQPEPSAPIARESDTQAKIENNRLKAAMSAGTRWDANELSKLDKQGRVLAPNGLPDEKRQTDTPTGDFEANNLSPPPPGDTVTASRAVAAPAPQQQEESKATKKEFSADKAMKAPTATNELTVQAQAAAAPIVSAPKSAPVLADQRARSESGNLSAYYKAKDGYVGGAAIGGLMRAATPRWQLSPEGKLIKSSDQGKSWQTVSVADKVVLRALCVTGQEVWVGGAQGNLYYSSDAGQQWEQVKPTANGQILTADIATIEFKDPQHGKVTTSDHQTWTTADGGHAWQVETR